jgi:hypothetical protein
MQFDVQASPDVVACSGALSSVTSALNTLKNQMSSSLAGLSCPQLEKIDQDQFKKFPGYKGLDYKTGTY